MYRILIVDDEPLILNGLVQLCSRITDIELEVYAASTSQEALAWLTRTKVDIVLSDIRMPGMSGLELHQEITKQWPKCKVIFLTGYSDFSYIQQAIRQGSVDYILKTEGNAKILDSIHRAAGELEEERNRDSLYIQAQEQKMLALPYLQQQYLSDILQGDCKAIGSIHEKFDDLHIELSDDSPCLLMIARIDDWGDMHSSTDRALFYFALDNITSELLMPLTKSLSMKYEKSKMVWFLQPAEAAQATEGWTRTILFVREMLEEIQQTCIKLLKCPISLALAADAVEWPAITQKFDLLNMMLHSGLGIGKELILLEQSKGTKGTLAEMRLSSVHLHKIEYLKACMENGHEESFFETLDELLSFASQAGSFPSGIQLELYFLLVSVFLPHSLRDSVSDSPAELDLGKFTQMEWFESWHQICEEFILTARRIFEQKQAGLNVQENELIWKIQNYITTHMSGDVSLTKIGEVVGHNPSYLSRLYKKLTGQGLSAFINDVRLEKSKSMLEEDDLKVHEIAAELGFLSSQYFHRFFKKATNLTPQEYRELKKEQNE
ncbi:response regulator [Paenibacillus sp. KQZ6P-2]|uniref:Response regulator n=1 Tax=Paenibacillus mangrovi TaxID=2931978 RepID=A0A9X1WS81_9BACL|nr:response regulator [Paenibacillus mangrovi]MCJ8012658.1 response regulator [Paenibacillus mangrovi]